MSNHFPIPVGIVYKHGVESLSLESFASLTRSKLISPDVLPTHVSILSSIRIKTLLEQSTHLHLGKPCVFGPEFGAFKAVGRLLMLTGRNP
jgi:hypothetical protein